MRKREGFTIIEVLVVVTIISILASILLPVFCGAREKGRQVHCLNNLRQLGLAMRMYADDHNGCLPAARVYEGGDGNPRGNWAGVYELYGKCDPTKGQIYQYVNTPKVYKCPSTAGMTPMSIDDQDALPYPLSYSMNFMLSYRSPDAMKAPSGRVGLLLCEDLMTINDGDFNWQRWATEGQGNDRPSRIHNGASCVLYCDLHVECRAYETVMESVKNDGWNPDVK